MSGIMRFVMVLVALGVMTYINRRRAAEKRAEARRGGNVFPHGKPA